MEYTPHDDDDDAEDGLSGMPEGEPELTPMGVDPDADPDDEDEPPEKRMPGFPVDGEPEVSG